MEFGLVWFSAALLCALALVPIVYLVRSRRLDLSAQQAARYERVAKLPFGTGVLIGATQVTYSLGLGRMAASRYPAAFRPQGRRSPAMSGTFPQGDGA